MNPTIIITKDGVPMWNDERGGVHLPTQFRSALKAEHKPIAPITFKQMAAYFLIEGDSHVYQPGDFFCMTADGKPLGLTAAEFASKWESTGVVA